MNSASWRLPFFPFGLEFGFRCEAFPFESRHRAGVRVARTSMVGDRADGFDVSSLSNIREAYFLGSPLSLSRVLLS
jgi:hypothetical protein